MEPDRDVIKTEDGDYITIPDGDPATVEEICRFERKRTQR